jgi:hypothetical protein
VLAMARNKNFSTAWSAEPNPCMHQSLQKSWVSCHHVIIWGNKVQSPPSHACSNHHLSPIQGSLSFMSSKSCNSIILFSPRIRVEQ